ncbi:hypothetical protein FQZ97_1253490 [compost metagenome]
MACVLQVHQARWHVFHLQAAYLASARAALREMADFAHTHAAGAAQDPAPTQPVDRCGMAAT